MYAQTYVLRDPATVWACLPCGGRCPLFIGGSYRAIILYLPLYQYVNELSGCVPLAAVGSRTPAARG
jgi:hypothetical protein